MPMLPRIEENANDDGEITPVNVLQLPVRRESEQNNNLERMFSENQNDPSVKSSDKKKKQLINFPKVMISQFKKVINHSEANSEQRPKEKSLLPFGKQGIMNLPSQTTKSKKNKKMAAQSSSHSKKETDQSDPTSIEVSKSIISEERPTVIDTIIKEQD